uniref:NADH-ubiquinone oxidoreductase chain 6 n=1 Tax=Xyleus modestus TaxID=747044 RepID=E0YCI4_9ORTH|nr:NADH dehydrogenase subunit 6 [Xyleus modestus]ADD97019.1 NADH dehydrogenase subunit 6 [Xyleus modestus]
MKSLLLALSNILNIGFIKTNHPMSLLIFIILQTFLVGLTVGAVMESFWLAYILFLIFLGGMLVLFIYITSIASNENFFLKFNVLIIAFVSLTLMLIVLIITNALIMDSYCSSETVTITYKINYQEMTMSISKLYNKPTFPITLMVMIYLFLALLVVVKITNINQGPIRKIS